MDKKRFFIFRFTFWLTLLTIVTCISLVFGYFSPYVHPGEYWIFSFFGLGYPIALGGAILLTIIWTLKKSKWALILLLVIICGSHLHMRFLAFSANYTPSSVNKSEWKVSSYNVQVLGIYSAKRGEKNTVIRDSILKYLQKVDADVYCFQEFYKKDNPTNFNTKDTIIDLLNTPYYSERYSRDKKGKQHFGIAAFSKYPIIAKGEVSFPNSEDNYCIYLDVVKQQDTMRIYNVHLQSIKLQRDDLALFGDTDSPSGEKSSSTISLIKKLKNAFPERVSQAERVIEHSLGSPYDVIICGDFNDTPLSYCYNLFKEQYTDAFTSTSYGFGRTYAGKVPAGRIDYIFHSKRRAAKDFEIQSEKLSDHYGISCVIE